MTLSIPVTLVTTHTLSCTNNSIKLVIYRWPAINGRHLGERASLAAIMVIPSPIHRILQPERYSETSRARSQVFSPTAADFTRRTSFPFILYPIVRVLLLLLLLRLQIMRCPDSWQPHCPRLDREVCIADSGRLIQSEASCQRRNVLVTSTLRDWNSFWEWAIRWFFCVRETAIDHEAELWISEFDIEEKKFLLL